MANSHTGRWSSLIVLLIIIGIGGWFAWQSWLEVPLAAGFASGNGRIESTEIDIATKLPGRLAEVLAREGDSVAEGQVVGRMDTKSLEAKLRQAEAQVDQARRERDQAAAIIRQRESECALEKKELNRSRSMYKKERGAISQEKLDRDIGALEAAEAVCAVAEARFATVGAKIEAADAEVERIRVEIDDSVLRSRCGGHVCGRRGQACECGGENRGSRC
jgi:HlyD family secretion protein